MFILNNIFDNLRTWAEVDLDCIEENFDAARASLPDNIKLLAVIKANAYGHGAVTVAKLLEKKADYFAVATADEAFELRNHGIKTPVLLLGHIPYGDFPLVAELDITPVISDMAEAEALSKAAVSAGKNVKFHFAVDTGMSRIGFAPTDESIGIIKKIVSLDNITAEGIFSHLAAADIHDKTYYKKQYKIFKDFTDSLDAAGVKLPIKHLFNSASIADYAPSFNMVREGIILYGLKPSYEVEFKNIKKIKPAMALKTHIVQIKTVPAGTAISYGCTYVAKSDTVIATLSAGYADGVPRLISNKGSVIINGCFAPITGRICMDQFMVDVTGIPNVSVGGTATIFGSDGGKEIFVDDIADSIGTIGYELVCNINPRVPRVYLKDKKPIGMVRGSFN